MQQSSMPRMHCSNIFGTSVKIFVLSELQQQNKSLTVRLDCFFDAFICPQCDDGFQWMDFSCFGHFVNFLGGSLDEMKG